jgi:hypothetical protein
MMSMTRRRLLMRALAAAVAANAVQWFPLAQAAPTPRVKQYQLIDPRLTRRLVDIIPEEFSNQTKGEMCFRSVERSSALT